MMNEIRLGSVMYLKEYQMTPPLEQAIMKTKKMVADASRNNVLSEFRK